METIERTTGSRRKAAGLPLSLFAIGALVAGCGAGSDYKNDPRPPAPINVTASISDSSVSTSPAEFGAGPIVVTVTNQSGASQDLTLETDALNSSAGIKQSTGPINPRSTGRIKVTVKEGTYKVSTGDSAIRPASLKVGAERASAQNEVLQP